MKGADIALFVSIVCIQFEVVYQVYKLLQVIVLSSKIKNLVYENEVI